MLYTDGFVLPIPRKNIKAYQRMAKKAATIWMDHGALEYREWVGEDLNVKFGVPYPRQLKAKKNETVVIAWIVFKSRKHRDQVNAKVMKDPRIGEFGDPKNMPFDCNRMLYGGFELLVKG